MPLAHILMPQIARKAVEIAQAVNPQPTGYLQDIEKAKQQVRQRITAPPDVRVYPKQSKNAPDNGVRADVGYLAQTANVGSGASAPAQTAKVQPKKGETPSAAALRELRAMPNRGTGQVARDAMTLKLMREGQLPGGIRPMPNAPAAPEQLGFGVQPGVIALPAGAIGMTEGGQPVDKRGKKIGYLGGDPNVRFPTADPMNPHETGGAGILKRMPGAEPTIERRYRTHLEAMQANRDENGMPTDKLPKGYFEAIGRERGKPFSKAEQDDILNGIKALRQIDKGVVI